MIALLGFEALNTVPGDLDGDGDVDFSDFLVLSHNFGEQKVPYIHGDIDLSGSIEFTDFLILSAGFGTAPAISAVPEPTTCALSLLGIMSIGLLRMRRTP